LFSIRCTLDRSRAPENSRILVTFRRKEQRLGAGLGYKRPHGALLQHPSTPRAYFTPIFYNKAFVTF
jgi:hypothetical protein